MAGSGKHSNLDWQTRNSALSLGHYPSKLLRIPIVVPWNLQFTKVMEQTVRESPFPKSMFYPIAAIPVERRISQIKFAGKRIVVDNKNPCSQGIAPVAKAIPVRLLRQGRKPRNLSATFSSLAASSLVLLEAVESRLVSRGKLCSPLAGSALAPPLGRAPSRQ